MQCGEVAGLYGVFDERPLARTDTLHQGIELRLDLFDTTIDGRLDGLCDGVDVFVNSEDPVVVLETSGCVIDHGRQFCAVVLRCPRQGQMRVRGVR